MAVFRRSSGKALFPAIIIIIIVTGVVGLSLADDLSFPKYVGCHRNHNDFVERRHDTKYIDIFSCLKECITGGEKYAILRGINRTLSEYSECHCRTNVTVAPENYVTDDKCDKPCPTVKQVACGAQVEDYLSIYEARCPAGYWGHSNVSICSRECHCLHNKTCDFISGHCPDGMCQSGWMSNISEQYPKTCDQVDEVFVTRTERKRLYHDMFVKRDSAVTTLTSSGKNQARITIGVALRQLINVDVRHQVITASVWMRLYWTDEDLTWNPKDYNNISEIHIPKSRHWKPELVLYNNAAVEETEQLYDVISIVNYTGGITYLFPATYKFSCTINVEDFPFDQQECEMKLGSWTYNVHYLNLTLRVNNSADVDHYTYNTEWDLVDFTGARNERKYGCCDDPYVDVTFSLTIRRRYPLYVWYLILPTVIISLLAALQFLLPCESGEKITLGITVLLSLVVFLLVLVDILPITENVPLIAKYMSAILILVGISQVITIITLRIHHYGTPDKYLKMPRWARRYLLHGLASLLRMRHRITDDKEHAEKLKVYEGQTAVEIESVEELEKAGTSVNGGQDDTPTDSANARFPRTKDHPKTRTSVHFVSNQMTRSSLMVQQPTDIIMAKILQQLENFHRKWTEAGKHAEVSSEWQQLAMVLDRLFLYIYLLLSIIIVPVIFANRTFHDMPIKR